MGDIRINKVHQVHTQKTEQKQKNEGKPEQEITKKTETPQKDASEILDYMANSSALNKSQVKSGQKVNVAKYVDGESADRIEKVVKAFEETILKSAEVAIKEFGLSEQDGQDVAIMAFNQRFLV